MTPLSENQCAKYM